KAPPHKDAYPFSKQQHGNYLRGWNEVTAPVHAMNGRDAVTRDEYGTQTGRPDLHSHYMGAYASAWSKLHPDEDNPHWEHLPDSARNPRTGAADGGTGQHEDTNRCSDCGHLPGCGCTHHCDNDSQEHTRRQAVRHQADTLTQPHQTTDDVNPPYNSA